MTDDDKWTRTNELRQVEHEQFHSDGATWSRIEKSIKLQQKYSSNLVYGEFEWRDVPVVKALDVGL